MQNNAEHTELKYLFNLTFLNVFFTIGALAIDSGINKSENLNLIAYSMGSFFILTLSFAFIALRLSTKNLLWFSIFSLTGFVNFFCGFAAALSLPVLIKLKGSSSLYIIITITCISWLYQYYATYSNKEVKQEVEMSLRYKLSEQKTQKKKNRSHEKTIGLDFMLPKWLEPARPVLLVLLVVSMLGGLNLRKLFPVAAGIMWSVPLLLTTSLCAVLIARFIIWYQEYKKIQFQQ